jgi:enamine deaminase RidA (YjgF/YER057c/UK114 family)
MANFAAMNEVYKTYFPAEPPARATVRADLVNNDFLVEIEAIAVVG